MKKNMSKVEDSFSEFHDKWMCQLEHHLQNLHNKLSKAEDDDEVSTDVVTSAVTAHYKHYYTVKWAAAHEDVLAFFSPVWLSPIENAYSWITDWPKPSMVFQLIDSLRKKGGHVEGTSLADMTEEQVKKMEELRIKIRTEEEKVEREMERLQVGLADRKMVELARLAARIKKGETTYPMEGLVEVGLKGMLSGLERVMKTGDCVRLKTLKLLLEILQPLQCVRFLAAMSFLQIQIRQLGKKHIYIAP